MPGFADIPPKTQENILTYVVKIQVEDVAPNRRKILFICWEKSLAKFRRVSRAFRAFLAPPPPPPGYVSDGIHNWLGLPADD